MLQFKEDESIEGNKNRLPSSELVSPVTPVKTVAMSSAATPAAPKAMPEAALQSHVLAFTMEDIIHSSQSIQESRVKGKKRYRPLVTSLSLSGCMSPPGLLPVFSSLSLGIYIQSCHEPETGRQKRLKNSYSRS